MINVKCSSCKKVHKAQKAAIGRRVQCKDCGAAFVVKAAATAPAVHGERTRNKEAAAVAESPAIPPSDGASMPGI